MKNHHVTNSKAWLGAVLMLMSFVGCTEQSDKGSNINKDQIQGRVDETKGTIKEATGKMLDDKSMQIEGNIQKNLGKAQAGYGDIKKDIKDQQ